MAKVAVSDRDSIDALNEVYSEICANRSSRNSSVNNQNQGLETKVDMEAKFPGSCVYQCPVDLQLLLFARGRPAPASNGLVLFTSPPLSC